MSNELYGRIVLDVSVTVESNTEELAMLEGNKAWNSLNAEERLVENFKELGLDIHSAKVEWQEYFGQDE